MHLQPPGSRACGLLVIENMGDVGQFMNVAGLSEWWRLGMGYGRK